MSVGLLDLNDCNLQLWHQDTRVQSPGYALFQGKEYLFGAPARAAARLQPRDINTRYWWQLSTEVLQPALGPARHTGDLVHAHLRQLHQEAKNPAEVLLAVSGSMQHQQLALLLGIVQQCPFDAVGLVNRSVALGSLYGRGERVFHLEIQLHQAVVSELARQDNVMSLQRTVPLPGCGLLQLQERLVEIIAAEFVRQTRFDPRRKAATEQHLYDALPAALRALQSDAETNLDINGYQARINALDLRVAGQRLFDSARESIGLLRADDLVIADPLAALLPGLGGAFQQLEILQADDIQRALRAHQEQLVQREQALSFVTALPCLAQAPVSGGPAAPTPAAEPPRRPTHLLQRHLARPLIESGTALGNDWELYWSSQGWQLRGAGTAARVNDRAYLPGQILGTGDAIAIGGADPVLLIEVSA
ncbi:MAG: hypothetical protein R3E50_07685 [Halioglobus sp.]